MPRTALLQARMSVSFIFFANGFVVANWLPHIPEVKGATGARDFRLGVALFAMAVVFGAAGRTQGTTTGLGIAAVATAGHGGLLAGPPTIGLTAEVIGLHLALATILFGMLAVAVFAGLVGDEANGIAPSLD